MLLAKFDNPKTGYIAKLRQKKTACAEKEVHQSALPFEFNAMLEKAKTLRGELDTRLQECPKINQAAFTSFKDKVADLVGDINKWLPDLDNQIQSADAAVRIESAQLSAIYAKEWAARENLAARLVESGLQLTFARALAKDIFESEVQFKEFAGKEDAQLKQTRASSHLLRTSFDLSAPGALVSGTSRHASQEKYKGRNQKLGAIPCGPTGHLWL